MTTQISGIKATKAERVNAHNDFHKDAQCNVMLKNWSTFSGNISE